MEESYSMDDELVITDEKAYYHREIKIEEQQVSLPVKLKQEKSFCQLLKDCCLRLSF